MAPSITSQTNWSQPGQVQTGIAAANAKGVTKIVV